MTRSALLLSFALGACVSNPSVVDVQMPDLSHARYAEVHNDGPEQMRLMNGASPVRGVSILSAGQTARVEIRDGVYAASLVKGN